MKLYLAGRGILHYDGRRQKLDGNLLHLQGGDEKINPADALEYICLVSFPWCQRGNGQKLIWSE